MRDRTQRLEQLREFQSQEIESIDKIVVEKSERRIYLMLKDEQGELQVYRTYPMTLGFEPIGHKVQEGDGKTPEGSYTIDFKNPKSRYHLSLKISYPNEADAAHAKSLGVSPGGDIFIHGMPNELGPYYDQWIPDWMGEVSMDLVTTALEYIDWTWGCIAVTNEAVAEIYQLVKVGTPIEINP